MALALEWLYFVSRDGKAFRTVRKTCSLPARTPRST